MTQTRRVFLQSAAMAAGAVTFLPYAARAVTRAGDKFATSAGDITVYPIEHASFVMLSPVGVIYCDPVGAASLYEGLPTPDLILITHEHGDHYNAETLAALMGENTKLLTNPGVFDKLPEELKAKAEQIGNGDSVEIGGLSIDAIPAYNFTQGRTMFHPEGRDNGYVLNFDGFRVYISGDTEDTPEMRALKDIDLAFLCMNLPYTMDAEAAASAVAEFQPSYVYPYHFRGKDGGTQDPEAFAGLVGDASKVRIGDWYPNGMG
ncbi:MBL fold metallo-hydrolase [Puniceibacterium sediminis]|uniref:L-ascorbate metabolism protein UlaG, beta-lactamase superfamily n=1 Tax=Puniceibacterium sediminis TaxID=1608407 RepID=A0A238Z6C7_9RHOB|nr:MBL fold metallo-hydrolase [Puniceibacterium sediminis]SNR78967.1 L-ascorbate metabolism protein UlaG, beta-lactamase superfamily [Puniceibacterium sediminis]